MKIAIGSDHGGFEIKELVKGVLSQQGTTIEDVGCSGTDSVDYPDYASLVAREVSLGSAEMGILVCTTGIGMSIAANKFPRVRAALCMTPHMAMMARHHNDANVLVLAGGLIEPEEAEAIVGAWFKQEFSGHERHERRLDKLRVNGLRSMAYADLAMVDPEVASAVHDEVLRQDHVLNLIASENTVSRAVREAQSSVMTNKYAEGYPGKRWYNGCEQVDRAEQLAIDRAKKLFGAEHANVQTHCGSSANMAVYFAMLEPGDTVLAMSLAHGGHLTHGSAVNFSGRLFNFESYGVEKASEKLDYDEIARLARECKPRLIVTGASAYPRVLDFAKFRAIADEVGALLMVDMAHIAGLVAGGVHPSPVPYSDFVTSTTHKTLRGPRAGLVLCREQYAGAIDKVIFPGIQGGPLMHTIAAKAVCFKEAMSTDFADYARQVVQNAIVLADELALAGYRIVSGGTDNHLMLVDLTPNGLTGRDAATALDKAGLVVNKNSIPFDKQSPFVTSGIRIGTPTVTSRGMKDEEMRQIASLISRTLDSLQNERQLSEIRSEVKSLCEKFPIL